MNDERVSGRRCQCMQCLMIDDACDGAQSAKFATIKTTMNKKSTMRKVCSLVRISMLIQALFCSSLAFSSDARPIIHLWGSHQRTSTQRVGCLSSSPAPQAETEENLTKEESSRDSRLSKRTIFVESTLSLPFSQTTAFDAFSDLTRQVEYSPWLKSVDYLNPPEDGVDTIGKDLGETKWCMAYCGIRFSWNSIVSRLDRPHTLEWESTSGMKNYGSVNFVPIDDKNTTVTMRMSFVTPRLVAALFNRSNKIVHVVENRIIRTTLINFRDTIAAQEDLIR